MISGIQGKINSIVQQLASGIKEQTPIEKVRTVEAKFEHDRLDHAVHISNQLEIRIKQQEDVLELVNQNLDRVSELMIDNNSYDPENAELVNQELTSLRDGLVGLLNSQNIQGVKMFTMDRQQLDSEGGLIDEFADGTAIQNAIDTIDNFIANKDINYLSNIQDQQEELLVQMVGIGARLNRLDDTQEISNKKLLRYQEIQSINEDADMAELASDLQKYLSQQQAEYTATAMIQKMSLFNYL